MVWFMVDRLMNYTLEESYERRNNIVSIDFPNIRLLYVCPKFLENIILVMYPYSLKYRDSGDYYYCNSLAYYSWKSEGVDISYGGVTTVAAEVQGLQRAEKSVHYEEMQPRKLIFYSYCQNGRYKDICHIFLFQKNKQEQIK